MAARRDVLFGISCVAAVGAAEYLRPRERLLLMRGELDSVVPVRFGDWVSTYDGSLVLPVAEGSLASRLYGDMITRSYRNQNSGEQVMLLVAYGESQSDYLQLHRPESCYPAVGLPIVARREFDLDGPRGVRVPAVELTAQNPGRTEDIVYWARIGNSLPQNAAEQRQVKLRLAIEGYVPDGILVRASALRTGPEASYAMLCKFLNAMLATIPAERRPGFIGAVANA